LSKNFAEKYGKQKELFIAVKLLKKTAYFDIILKNIMVFIYFCRNSVGIRQKQSVSKEIFNVLTEESMKNCKYMRKIGFAIKICLTVFLTCALPAAAFAEGSAAPAERESVHFIAPTAITVVGGYLYVADNIEENKCAIICFDASEANPEPKYTFVLDMNISGLSNNGSDIIYAFWHNIILELHLRENDLP